ncbi:hypothetical protein C3L33_03858, partial [Rhododendron williamsianum]
MASLFQVTVTAMLLLFSHNFVLRTIFLFPFVNASFSPSPLPSPTQHGFVARLIHRTSPDSPFYNPHATHEDLMREDIRTSQERSLYLHQFLKGATSMKLAKAPISKEFVMNFSIGTPPQNTYAVPDTGSSLIWMQCNPCNRCYDQKIPRYNSRMSRSYEEVLCKRYPSFSYCTTKDPNTGVVEGWIHFGSASKLFGPSTPLLANPTNNYYYLSFEGISVEGQELTLPEKVFDMGFIIDSGAALTHLQTDAFDKLIDAVKKQMPDDEVWTRDEFELCYDNPYRVPEIKLKFEDMDSFPLRDGNAWSGFNVGYDLENKQLWLKYVNSCPDDDDEDI